LGLARLAGPEQFDAYRVLQRAHRRVGVEVRAAEGTLVTKWDRVEGLRRPWT
jgi:hypothetical protein